MKQNMESKQSMRDGSVAESGGDHVVQPLPASEQFYTRSCARCAGLLVTEWESQHTMKRIGAQKSRSIGKGGTDHGH